MRVLNNIKIGNRLNLILGSVIVLCIMAMGFYIVSVQKQQTIESNFHQMNQETANAMFIIDGPALENQYRLSTTFQLAVGMMNKDVNKSIDSKEIDELEVKNRDTNEKIKVSLPQLLFDGRPALRDTLFSKIVFGMTFGYTQIFQLTEEGFVRITSYNVCYTKLLRVIIVVIIGFFVIKTCSNSGSSRISNWEKSPLDTFIRDMSSDSNYVVIV